MYYHIIKDGSIIGRTSSKKAAIEMIRADQAHETHYLLRSSYGYLATEAPSPTYVKYKRK